MKPPPARRLGVSFLKSASFLPASSPSMEAGDIRRSEINGQNKNRHDQKKATQAGPWENQGFSDDQGPALQSF